MIIINNSGYLKYKKIKFRCSLGKAGINKKKREGDNITPKGIYKIIKIYYRQDKIKKISSKFELIKITKSIGWCDDPKSSFYNQEIKIPFKYGHEKFFKKNDIYDLILVLNYNMSPTIKFKGSAIFIHVAKKNYKPTAGCIGLKKKNLINLVSKINIEEKVIIQ
jgi:L,D-peptidoglycan transpeptidase YkuD (ErfK/YbiS/YcfS/YnhG family)